MSSTRIRNALLMASAIALAGVATSARADLVSWDVDPTQSFVRLNIADQAINLDGTEVTVRLRDAGSNSNWTDNGGRRAFLDGTIVTKYNDGGTLKLLGGYHNLFALENTNLRPNPASFNPANTNAENPNGQFSGSSTAPAAFGARARAGVGALNADAAFLAMRDVFFDVASGELAMNSGGTGTIPGSSTQMGIPSLVIDVDGLNVVILFVIDLGQPIPDTLNESLSLPNFTNTAAGTVTNLGGNNRRLNLTVNVPVAIDIDGTIINGNATGQLVAFAVVPEPSSVALMSFGTAALGLSIYRRRFRVRK